MAEMLGQMPSWLSLLPRISLGNILEIGIIFFLVYEVLFWIKNTRAWNLLKGLVVTLIFVVFAAVLYLTTILWIMENAATITITALSAIFQSELREAPEQLGSHNILSNILFFDEGKESQNFNDKTINELVRTTFEMVKVRTGALMVIEKGSSLKEIERTGVEINGLVTSQLPINIFEHSTPLHDGAVMIRGNRVTATTCYLPLSDSMTISKDLGTCHRAAVGISEVTDDVTIVVSEETGRVSVAAEGYLTKTSDTEGLKNVPSPIKEESVSLNRFKLWKGRLKNGKKAI